MQACSIETTYRLPIYRHRSFEADTLDGDSISAATPLHELKRRVLHLRIVSNSRARFLAWDAVVPTQGPIAMTLAQIEAWMRDDPPTKSPPEPAPQS